MTTPSASAANPLTTRTGSPRSGPDAAPSRLAPARVEDPLRWDRHEKALAWSYGLLSAIDALQVIRMPEGFQEGNPFLGSHPSNRRVIALKVALGGAVLHLADRTPHGKRKIGLWIANLLQLAAVAHNERVTGGIVF